MIKTNEIFQDFQGVCDALIR